MQDERIPRMPFQAIDGQGLTEEEWLERVRVVLAEAVGLDGMPHASHWRPVFARLEHTLEVALSLSRHS